MSGGLATGLGQGGEEAAAVHVIPVNRLAMIAAIQDVINRAGILDAQRAGHEPTLSARPFSVNSKERPSKERPVYGDPDSTAEYAPLLGGARGGFGSCLSDFTFCRVLFNFSFSAFQCFSLCLPLAVVNPFLPWTVPLNVVAL
jgi:hypothetical protein